MTRNSTFQDGGNWVRGKIGRSVSIGNQPFGMADHRGAVFVVVMATSKKQFTLSFPFFKLCNSSFRFRMLALEVEENLCSNVFQTLQALVMPKTSENTGGVSVELMKERGVLYP